MPIDRADSYSSPITEAFKEPQITTPAVLPWKQY